MADQRERVAELARKIAYAADQTGRCPSAGVMEHFILGLVESSVSEARVSVLGATAQVAHEVAQEFCGGSEAVEESILAKFFALSTEADREWLRKRRERALAEFTSYFVANYPGPNTIINDPRWHAPKIFRAAERAFGSEVPTGNPSDPDYQTDELLRQAGLRKREAEIRIEELNREWPPIPRTRDINDWMAYVLDLSNAHEKRLAELSKESEKP